MIESAPSEDLQGQRFTTSRGALQLWRRGNGPVVILLHDLATSNAAFRGIFPGLLRRHHVCAVDLLGHGGSSRDVADLSVAAQATAIAEMLEEMRLDRVAVVGHALGGSVAIRLAAVVPEKIEKVTLIAAGSYAHRVPLLANAARIGPLWGAIGLLGTSVRRRLAARVSGGRRRGTEPHPPSTSVRDREGWKALGLACRQAMRPETISQLEELVDRHLVQPTLAIWGSDDPVSPISAARMVFEEKPNVRLIEIAGGGHSPHEDHPEIVADLIVDFLR